MLKYLHDFYLVENTAEQNFIIAFGQNLKKLRKQKGFTQEQLANDLNVEISQISRIERGVINTSIGNCFRIAEILDADILSLFDFEQS